jgi:hypothetical protein
MDGAPALMMARPSSRQKLLGRYHQLSLATFEGAPDPVEGRLYDRIGQLRTVEPLPEPSEFFFFCVAATALRLTCRDGGGRRARQRVP